MVEWKCGFSGVGGAANHWGGLHWRYLPSDHLCRSHIVDRYGAKVIPADMTIQDWAMTYDELKPYYDKFEKLCGVSGKAGNLRGQKIDGGNVFEGSAQNEYPNPPLKMTSPRCCSRRRRRSSAIIRSRNPSATQAGPIPTARALRSAAASIAATATSTGCEANAKAGPQACILPLLRRIRNSRCGPTPG